MGIVGKSVYFLRLCVHLFYHSSVFLSFVLASLMLVCQTSLSFSFCLFHCNRLSSKLPNSRSSLICLYKVSILIFQHPFFPSLLNFLKATQTEAILPYHKNILLLIYQVAERETVGEKPGRRIKRKEWGEGGIGEVGE